MIYCELQQQRTTDLLTLNPCAACCKYSFWQK